MAIGRVTDLEIVQALRAYAKHGTLRGAGRELGTHNSVISRRLELATERGLTVDSDVASREDRLEIELKASRAEADRLRKALDRAEKTIETIWDQHVSREPQPVPWLDRPDSSTGHRGCPVTLWSDWHYGEVVKPAEVGGVNEFNAEVAVERVNRLVDTTIDLCFNHMGRATAEYPGIVVCLGGDMISGDIHEELFATNDRTPQQCIEDLTDILAGALDKMASHFGRVFVPCVVGNHGRDSRKPRMKGRVHTSHEWNIYKNVARCFRSDDRVKFLIPDQTDALFEVFGTRFLLTHGDSLGVKGGDGIIGAIGPIMRGTMKVGDSESQIGRDFDYILMGHWHQPLWLPRGMVNNSLKGYDEFARLALRAPAGPASQLLWFVHPKHGITARWEVLLQERLAAREAGPDEAWASWRVA